MNCDHGRQCFNGGVCVAEDEEGFGANHRCRCPNSYTGLSCEHSIQDIAPTNTIPVSRNSFQWGDNIASLSLVVAALGLLLGVALFSLASRRRTQESKEPHLDVHYSTVELECQRNIV